MRKFTLFAIAALISVMAFAQKQARQPQRQVYERALLQVKPSQKTMKTIATRQRRVAKAPETGTLVELPSGVTPETYYTNGGTFAVYYNDSWVNATSYMPSINVAIDGTDIYIQGLAFSYEEAWIKGTIDGTTATFPSGQLVGEDEEDGPEYIVGSNDGKTVADIVFDFDSANGVLEATTTYIIESESAEEVSAFAYWSNAIFTKEEPAKPELVVLPDGVELVDYVLIYTDYNNNPASGKAAVGIDGDDVYFQGFSTYYPEALIKGKKEGNTITFPGNQLLGIGSDGAETYFVEEAVFTYDAASDTYTAEGDVYSLEDNYYIDVWATDPVLKGVVEKAAMPANPSITGLENSKYGYYVSYNIPVVDVNGDGMVTSKLSFIIFTDIEGEIAPLTFTPDTHVMLTEDMTEIPYGFTEDYDFYNTYFFLNDLYSKDWNNIGIQSIYTGGGETNATEIQWYHIKDYAVPTSANTWVAADQGYKDTEEVTEIKIGESVAGTLSRAVGNNPPKYYTSGTALRMYAGNTLTIQAEEPMVKIVFTMTGSATQMLLEADKGEYSLEENIGTWTGEADEVVFTVPDVSKAQARIQKIEVFFAGGSEEPVLVELPEGVEPEIWTLEGTYYTNMGPDDQQFATEVAFDGNDIYVKGLAYYFEDAWIKGTIDKETGIATFPKYQYVGSDDDGDEYLLASDEEMETEEDILFAYDAEAQTLTQLNDWILENGGNEGISAWGGWTNVLLYAGEPIVIDPVVAPDGLTTETYIFKASSLEYKSYSDEEDFVDYKNQVQVGFAGNDLFIQGLAKDAPDLWVKATKNEKGQYVIPANQFMGTLDVGGLGWIFYDYYFTAVDEADNLTDVVLDYNAETSTFTTDQTLALNEGKNSLQYYILFQDVTITKMQEFAARPADPEIVQYKPEDETPKIDFRIPDVSVNGEDLLTDKLFYQIFIVKDKEIQPLTLEASLYKNFDEDMTIIPYTFNDSYDIWGGGERVYLNQGAEEIASWTNIGVQSIYTGGGETNKSNVVWYIADDPVVTAIAGMNAADKVNARFFDLQGRTVENSQKGLLIMQYTDGQGNVKTAKVVRR